MASYTLMDAVNDINGVINKMNKVPVPTEEEHCDCIDKLVEIRDDLYDTSLMVMTEVQLLGIYHQQYIENDDNATKTVVNAQFDAIKEKVNKRMGLTKITL